MPPPSPSRPIPAHIEVHLPANILGPRSHAAENLAETLSAVQKVVSALPFVSDGPLPPTSHPPRVQRMLICGVADAQAARGDVETRVPFWRVAFTIHAYTCVAASAYRVRVPDGLLRFAAVLELPSASLEGLWETLEFPREVKAGLLGYIATGCFLSARGVDANVVTWNRLAVLHGPPGTGKTSLCRALAHKLSIRLDARMGVLIDVQIHALLSKYFSESSHNVSSLFSEIREQASQRDLVIVLLDEVESLSAARRASMSASEPSDALRLVNSLLTGIDSLRSLPNCLVLATSNLADGIDAAFLDRADVLQYVGLPSDAAREKVLQSCVEELVRKEVMRSKAEGEDVNGSETEAEKAEMLLEMDEDGGLERLVQKTNGFSGRMLRKLPLLALSIASASTENKLTYQEYINSMCEAAESIAQSRIGKQL